MKKCIKLVLLSVVILTACSKGVYIASEESNNSSSTSSSATSSGAYELTSGTVSLDKQSFSSSADDVSAVKVSGSTLTLTNSTISSSGNTSSQDNSSFYGLNAAVLATTGGTINLSSSTVTSTGAGANGVFAYGTGKCILENLTVKCTGAAGHGIMCSGGGTITATNVNMTTAGSNSGAIATDRGSGTITVTGGTVVTTGTDSPGIYSTGKITVTGAHITATGSEAAVIEGANSIALTNTYLSGAKKRGVMIYQSMSGDAEGKTGTFTMTGDTLVNTIGPTFYVTNSTGIVTVSNVIINSKSGELLKASADSWGTSGSNEGTLTFTANNEKLSGSVVADAISTISINLNSSSALSGVINNAKTAKSLSLTLDASSTWNVTADSYLTDLVGALGTSGSTISNITGNGYTVYYSSSSSSNSYLGGKTYSLTGGGYLKPY